MLNVHIPVLPFELRPIIHHSPLTAHPSDNLTLVTFLMYSFLAREAKVSIHVCNTLSLTGTYLFSRWLLAGREVRH